jgi:hypothetical protein
LPATPHSLVERERCANAKDAEQASAETLDYGARQANAAEQAVLVTDYQAKVSFWQTIATAGAFIAAAIAAFFAKRGADEMKRSSDATVKAAKAAETAAEVAQQSLNRPWLFADANEIATVSKPNGKELRYARVIITNYGNAPAVILNVEGVLFFNPGARHERAFEERFGKLLPTMRKFPLASEFHGWINSAGKRPYQVTGRTSDGAPMFDRVPEGSGIVIKPDGTHEFHFRADAEIDARKDDKLSMERIGCMYLIGRITYTSPNEDIECQTFTFESSAGGQFTSVGGAPYNERRRWKPKEIGSAE